MTLGNIFNNLVKTVKSHSPEILTALGASGVVTTAYLSAKASFKAAELIEVEKQDRYYNKESDLLTTKEKAVLVWKCYIPTGLVGTATVVCIMGARQASANRTAAAVAAYSLTERAFSEYKEKVVEQIGKNKEQRVRDDIAQDKVTDSPPSKEVVILGNGHVLCCDLYTHRYFRSNIETLRKAQNDINARLNNEVYVVLDEFYDLIGLPFTSHSGYVGWESDKLMELKFSTVMAEDGEPCLAYEFNYIAPVK